MQTFIWKLTFFNYICIVFLWFSIHQNRKVAATNIRQTFV